MAGVSAGTRRGALDETLPKTPGYEKIKVASGMGVLFARTVRATLTPPFNWPRELLAELSVGIRRCWVPLALSSAFFALGLAVVYFGGVVKTLGTIERMAGGIAVGSQREVSRWVTIMVVAGVVGSAITADLGARKIREELDALAVLGINQIRTLVVPRVLAMTIIMPLLGYWCLLIFYLTSYFASVAVYGDILSAAAFREVLWTFVYDIDQWSLIVQMTISGMFVGVVACYKGLNAGGGTEGVGRAVNECVLVSFFGVWFIHTMMTFIILSLFPEIQVLRG